MQRAFFVCCTVERGYLPRFRFGDRRTANARMNGRSWCEPVLILALRTDTAAFKSRLYILLRAIFNYVHIPSVLDSYCDLSSPPVIVSVSDKT